MEYFNRPLLQDFYLILYNLKGDSIEIHSLIIFLIHLVIIIVDVIRYLLGLRLLIGYTLTRFVSRGAGLWQLDYSQTATYISYKVENKRHQKVLTSESAFQHRLA